MFSITTCDAFVELKGNHRGVKFNASEQIVQVCPWDPCGGGGVFRTKMINGLYGLVFLKVQTDPFLSTMTPGVVTMEQWEWSLGQ